MVYVLFGVSAFVEPGAEIAVIGSSPSLGAWQPNDAVPLYPQSRIMSSVIPTTFMNWIYIPEIDSTPTLLGREPISYKFVRYQRTCSEFRKSAEEALQANNTELINTCPQTLTWTCERPVFQLSREFAYQWNCNKNEIQWEGCGPNDNRYLVAALLGRGYEIAVETLSIISRSQAYDDRDDQTTPFESAEWMFLPVADFLEIGSGVSEYSQTTRYYFTVKELRMIHFARVLPNVLVGSCPRRVSHLVLLKDMNVGCVFNFQANEDLPNNWINITDPEQRRTAAALAEIYAYHQLSLVHIPTVDMSTPARSSLMAQAACLIGMYLITNPKKTVYIHCNAGVGRAVAGVVSLLHFVLEMPEGEAIAFVKQKRPMAYPDIVAIRAGLRDFQNKYGRAIVSLKKCFSQRSDLS